MVDALESRVVRAATSPIILSLLAMVLVALLMKNYYLQFVLIPVMNQQAVKTVTEIANAAEIILNQTINKSFVSQALFIIFWLSWAWAPLLMLGAKKGKEEGNLALTENRKITVMLTALTAIAILVIYPFRYLYYPAPQGYDTPFYVTILNYMNQNPLETLLTLDRCAHRPMFFLIIYPLNKLMGYEELTLIALPVLLAILLAAATYTFTLKSIGDRFTASLAMLLTVASYSTIFLSVCFFANLLAVSILLLMLTSFLEANRKRDKRWVAVTVALFLTLAFLHGWTALMGLSIITLYTLITVAKSMKITGRERTAVGITAPMLLIIVAALILYPGYIPMEMMNPFTDPFTSASHWYWVSEFESPLILVLAILGLCFLARRNTPHANIITSWTLTVSLLILVVGFDQFNYSRLCVAYPLGILASNGLTTLIHRATTLKPNKTKATAFILTTLIATMLIASMTPVAYHPIHVHRPDGETMQQLYWIRNTFGYSNPNIIVPLYDPPAQPLEPISTTHLQDISVWGWARAIIGDVIYHGHILNLLNQDLDDVGRKINPQNKTIIIASRLYKITLVEEYLTEKISDIGIYVLKVGETSQVEELLKKCVTWMDQAFNNTWRIVTNTLKAQVTTTENQLTITIPPAVAGTLTIEYALPEKTTQNGNIYVKAKMELLTSTMIVETCNGVWLIQQKKVNSEMKDTWIILPSKDATNIKIKITTNGTLTQESVIVKYIAGF
ncbi:MAG: hypothetical protein QXW47_05115 [Candidatus Jordarchaeales archaeon]